jgi:hypothetical protein
MRAYNLGRLISNRRSFSYRKEEVDQITFQNLLAVEKKCFQNSRALKRFSELAVEPEVGKLKWDYGNEIFECFIVFKDIHTDTGIVYSEFGFGPKNPWGLVFLSQMRSGMDSGWFNNLFDCFMDTPSAGDLPIWILSKTNGDGDMTVIEKGMTIDQAFSMRDNRRDNPKDRSFVISYEKD